ncbi:GntR family transcriptional regulator [Pseudovibrio sp. Tun.PSC04-5.I4]|uniref:GntR family transcriptional regulator n=1 Tax=Pseudovibrio sp. Tun.PSC04-5.I4 TaxID=1798213 RepID=UPI0008808457|nr:GntR family transcriptional regulator [Pseudovibrio sp. Tun.PSC04-5.I4]SDQ21558.1 DNA-binding transcriptional regulator, GntR family [Pseudovibrio sp. Tun.PSC04-5.I4]
MPRPRKNAENFDFVDFFKAVTFDRTKPLGPQVYSEVRLQIVLSNIPPETQVNEPVLSHALNVSRTPMRYAYQKLISEQLIVSRPRSGSMVAGHSEKLIRDGIIIRRALEREIVRILCISQVDLTPLDPILKEQRDAVQEQDHVAYFKADERFHKMLAKLADLSVAWKLALAAKGHTDRARLSLMSKDSSRLNRAFTEHIELIVALETGNNTQAETLISRHVDAILQYFPE